MKRLLRESSRLYGYKFMHLKSIQHGFVVNQETVRLLMHFLDPVGIEHRRRGRLQRRVYNNPGPDFMWHMDSYDKLKPYGFCINGAIDGFSRCLIWLEVYTTSSDPAVIGSYFLKAVASKLGCPVRVRADRGTENGHVEAMQTFLRLGHGNTFSSVPFMYGSSNHNQRIEAWWCFLRRHMAQFWMNIFQDMKNDNIFDGFFVDKSLLQFCFMQLIQFYITGNRRNIIDVVVSFMTPEVLITFVSSQHLSSLISRRFKRNEKNDLDHVVYLWDTHRIRRTRHQTVPSGRPNTMYHLPEAYGTHHYLCPVSSEEIQECQRYCPPKSMLPCDRDIYELCCLIMAENNKSPPRDAFEAAMLYRFLRGIILQELQQ
ncbi:hypothetical protein KUTeg_015210 [Tegillarca granosa]|uniref:Integrase core domain-containing protein n=1 Tax=Tegillarca granosa TaxID=220873 RepID=A0ABQ9ERY0_TEGGR|nr:hypothetical protein KUTeg_015210 [Tegillarca granosa]